MNIIFNSLSNQIPILFKERLTVVLTDQQKRIAIICGLAMSALALCYALHHCYFKGTFTHYSSESPPDSPFPIKRSFGWEAEERKVKQFLRSERDLSKVAAMAKNAISYRSPLMDPDSVIYIGDLVRYASLEQTKAIVEAVADDRYNLRGIFSFLLLRISENPTHFDNWKQKTNIVLQALSHKQLMDILVFKKEESAYQFEENEINSIPLKGFLKWQVDLNLPHDFIKACEDIEEYAQFVKKEADKEREEGKPVAFD